MIFHECDLYKDMLGADPKSTSTKVKKPEEILLRDLLVIDVENTGCHRLTA